MAKNWSNYVPQAGDWSFEKKIIEANLNRELEGVKNRSAKGLILSMAHIRNQTETEGTLTPVDLGNMRSSWFVAAAKGKVGKDKWNKGFVDNPQSGIKRSSLEADHYNTISEAQAIVSGMSANKQIVVMGGYSANYTLWVHENLSMHQNKDYWEKKGTSWRPNSGPKWLEEALKKNTRKIVEIVKENAQIKG